MRTGLSSTLVTSSLLNINVEYAAYMDFSGSAPLRLWTGNASASFTDHWGTATYTAIGTLGNVSTATETTDTSAQGIDLTLTGIPSSYLSLALSNNYRGRDVAVYAIIYNNARTSYNIVCFFRGRMNQMIISEGETTSTITIKCESKLIEFQRVKDKRYTNEYQQSVYPTDKGLEFMAGMTKDIWWGRSEPTNPTSRGPESGGAGGESNLYEV